MTRLGGGAAGDGRATRRVTLDVDLTVWVEPDNFEAIIATLAARLAVRTQEPLAFARRARVMPVQASNGVLVDLVFAAWPLERRAIEHAVERSVAGTTVRVAGLDYLLFLKLISDRPRDQTDAAALLRRHRAAVDLAWLEHEISALAEAIAQPEMLERFRNLLGSGPAH